jgi:hypothetical protein
MAILGRGMGEHAGEQETILVATGGVEGRDS